MADSRSRCGCASAPLPCLHDHDSIRDGGQQFVAVEEIGLACIASLVLIEAERNLAHEKSLGSDLSEEMGILLREDEMYRRADCADHPSPFIDGSDSRRCIDTSSKTGSDSIAVGSKGMPYAPGCRDIEKTWLSRSGNAYASLGKQGEAAFAIEDRQRLSMTHEAGRELFHAQYAE